MSENLPIEKPSEREIELLGLLSEGLSNREIAQNLHISPNTVKVHLRNIYRKLQVSSRTEAVMVALQEGWVKVDTPASDTDSVSDQSSETVPELPTTEPSSRARRLWIYAASTLGLLLIALSLVWPRLRTLWSTSTPTPVQQLPVPQEASWQARPSLPGARSEMAAVFYEGQIWIIAGQDDAGVSDRVEVYDLGSSIWQSGPSKPTAVDRVRAVELRGRILVPGGCITEDQAIDRLEILDPDVEGKEAWSSAANLPFPVCAYALSTYEGDLYLFGGWDGQTYLTATLRYDPRQDAWQTLAPMPSPRAFSAAGTIGEWIYVVGGYDGHELDTCQAYDPNENLWQPCPSLAAPRAGIGGAVIDDKLYVVGGGWQASAVLEYNVFFTPAAGDPLAGAWQLYPSPYADRWVGAGVAWDKDRIYALGGRQADLLDAHHVYNAIYRIFLPMSLGGNPTD